MESTERFRVKTPDVTHEVIDDEAVIINLETGHYYSLQRVGAEVWTLLAATASIGAIVEHLTHRYACERPEAQSAVSSLVAELQDERLIVPVQTGDPEPVPQTSAGSGSRRAFEVPRLQKFTDMQELLLLDPIHDVDERGWPHAKLEDRRYDRRS